VESAFAFTPLVAAKLIVYTFGSLVHLFLMVLILGQRRLRTFEWLLFWLMAALFMWNSGNLLSLNVSLQYGVAPNGLAAVSRMIPFAGLILIAPLAVHVHFAYASRSRRIPGIAKVLVAAFYLPLAAVPWMVARLAGRLDLDPLLALRPFLRPVVLWVALALVVAAVINLQLRRRPEGTSSEPLHWRLAGCEGLLAAGLAGAYLVRPPPVLNLGGYLSAFLMFLAIIPSALAGYAIFRQKFLELSVQRNLAYTLITIFALLVYLDVIRRVSAYLEWKNILPSAVTETVMIFTLVVLLEPFKKLMDGALRAAFASEFERVQKLSGEVQECAKRTGDVEAVKRLVEERVPKELNLQGAELKMGGSGWDVPASGEPGKTRRFAIHRGEEILGVLSVEPVTSDLSGDQSAALQLLADQLAAALELCQLITEKVKLEHALADKAKMAFLGEMAARIAHNVKNPLSSMKTVVQLMEEDASLPERVRADCRVVAGEIDRLNANISQVLRYAKPAREVDRPTDLGTVVERVLSLTRAEAERRGVRLEYERPPAACTVEGGEEAASDIVSNLIVNAMEATTSGGKIQIGLARSPADERALQLTVEDEGPGIPAELLQKIFQPFFTTRPGGTGLGLAIVARRVEEIGGSVECSSPLSSQGGARFCVRFRATTGMTAWRELNQPKPLVGA
jgi:signal transduction histidine kinase